MSPAPNLLTFLQAELSHRKIHESGFYLSDKLRTLWWKCLHNETHSPLTSRDISTSSKNLLATISKASSGQAYRNSKKIKNKNQHRSTLVTLMAQHKKSHFVILVFWCRHIEGFSSWNCKQTITFLYAYFHHCGAKWECPANIDRAEFQGVWSKHKESPGTAHVIKQLPFHPRPFSYFSRRGRHDLWVHSAIASPRATSLEIISERFKPETNRLYSSWSARETFWVCFWKHHRSDSYIKPRVSYAEHVQWRNCTWPVDQNPPLGFFLGQCFASGKKQENKSGLQYKWYFF